MKKVLFVATVDSHIELFHLPYLKMFKDRGYEVHVATDSDKPIKYCDKKIKLPIKRSPFKISNLRAIRELRKVIDTEKYEIVHCHTPMGGVVARLATKKARRDGTRVIYTAHGFHFYKGAPILNWLLFYPVEKWLSKYTDTLITINTEDYERAKRKFGRRCYDIQYVPGVGVDEGKFEKKLSDEEKTKLRESLGLEDDDRVLICVGRLDKNKNQGFLIKVIKSLPSEYHLLLVGPDEIDGKYQKLADKLGVIERVHFLGFRDNILELLQISDVALSASKREGLPVNLIEAAMLGLPIVATDCRGNRDVCEKVGGKIVGQKNIKEFVNDVKKIILATNKECGIICDYSLMAITNRMTGLYGMSMPLVSIVVPAYNVEKYIDQCLGSLLEQTYKNIEIIVVDDGSTDGTSNLLKSYGDKIRVVVQRNQGLSVARNTGTKVARGKYILYVDSDDFLTNKNVISNMVEEVTRGDSDILFFRFNYYFDNNFSKPSKMIDDGGKSDAIDGYINMVKKDTLNISAWSKLIRLSIIKENDIKFEVGLLSEDIDFSLSLYDKISRMAVSNNIYYNYRQKREGSITNGIDEKNIKSLIYIINKWSSVEYADLAYKEVCLNYLAYQYSILLALSDESNTTEDEIAWIKENTWLLKYDLNFKVRMSRIFVWLFGYRMCIRALKKYNNLKNRGVVKI